jgi:hypothetical protein
MQSVKDVLMCYLFGSLVYSFQNINFLFSINSTCFYSYLHSLMIKVVFTEITPQMVRVYSEQVQTLYGILFYTFQCLPNFIYLFVHILFQHIQMFSLAFCDLIDHFLIILFPGLQALHYH